MLRAVSAAGVTGHLIVERRKTRPPTWVATINNRGERRRVTLGPAWVRDSGSRTPRGAVKWRTAPGAKPDETYLTPAEAESRLQDLLSDARRSSPRSSAATGAGKRWDTAVESWKREMRDVRGLESTTLRGYDSAINALRDAGMSDDLMLRRITRKKLESVQTTLLARDLSRKTVADYMRVAKAVLSHATKSGWLAHNVATDAELVRTPRPGADFRVLEPTDLEAVARMSVEIKEDEVPRYRGPSGEQGAVADLTLEAMRERRMLQSEAVRLLAYTGLRIGELRVLRWLDIDISGRTVRVPRNLPTNARAGEKPKSPKSKRPRSLPLIDQAIEALHRIERLGPDHGPDDLILVGKITGTVGVDSIREAFYRGLDRAGLSWMRSEPNPMVLHDLRHTFGTIAVRVFPLSDVQAYMGHADIQTTMRYVHHVPRVDAATRLSSAFSRDLNGGLGSGPEAPAVQAQS